MSQNPPIRVLLTKIGLDGHDRGYRLVAAALRDAGMEVILTGPWMSAAAVVNIAVQEDVDVIGISSLSFDHLLIPGLMARLKSDGPENVIVIVGGIVPDEDVPLWIDAGVAAVFPPGSSLKDLVVFLREKVSANRNPDFAGAEIAAEEAIHD
jgi:methylmalonyl-CoA mutase C-terminal domain/subunit